MLEAPVVMRLPKGRMARKMILKENYEDHQFFKLVGGGGAVNQGLTKEMKCEFIFFRDWAFETG